MIILIPFSLIAVIQAAERYLHKPLERVMNSVRLSINPHPQSLSLMERDFEYSSVLLPFALREKGLGDEG